ncbi:MAG: ornithine carbamoyltransferase [Candidatus Omnitrophica bacterium]|nr:ornithine carbamoyltransferase [Candidatus Omnitrophota bacterium]
MKRDLLSLQDLTRPEIFRVLDLTEKVKSDRSGYQTALQGKSIALVFQKPSNRTRVSFEVGINQLGGNCIYLGPTEINLGVRESVEDVSKTLSRYLDGIIARTFYHQDIVELSKNSSISIVNGLSDLYHPCQALTDIFSFKEKVGTLEGRTLAYIGDGNNVCHSLLLACSKVGINMNIATPPGYEPDVEILKIAQASADLTNAKLFLTHDPLEASDGVDVIYTDVWVSMGQEEEQKKRLSDFQGFQINSNFFARANSNAIFMHCLPAHRDQEVSVEVIDGPQSIVFDQAENRLHTQKAILLFLMEGLSS